MKELFVKSMAQVREPIACSDLCLCIALNIHENQIENAAGFAYRIFVEEFKDDFILDGFTDKRENAASVKLFDEFLKSIWKKRIGCQYGYFGYDGEVKSDLVTNKKTYKAWRDSLNFKEELFDNGKAVDYESVIKQIKEETAGKSQAEYCKKVFDAVISADKPAYVTYPGWSDFCFSFECNRSKYIKDFFQGLLEFSVSTYVLGDNVSEMAERLHSIAAVFCERFKECNAYVTIGSRERQYMSPKMEYFVEYDSGVILQDEKKFECVEWMDYKFIHGIEWSNILGKQIKEKIENPDTLKNIEGFTIENKEDVIAIKSNLPIEQYKSKMSIPIYNLLNNCIRPGYSVRSVLEPDEYGEIRPYWEELWFNDNEYEFDNTKIKFHRGNFNFLTKTY